MLFDKKNNKYTPLQGLKQITSHYSEPKQNL